MTRLRLDNGSLRLLNYSLRSLITRPAGSQLGAYIVSSRAKRVIADLFRDPPAPLVSYRFDPGSPIHPVTPNLYTLIRQLFGSLDCSW